MSTSRPPTKTAAIVAMSAGMLVEWIFAVAGNPGDTTAMASSSTSVTPSKMRSTAMEASTVLNGTPMSDVPA